MPWALIVNWYHPVRRRLLIVAAIIFYAARLASALYFAPNAIDWGNNPGEAAARIAEMDLWIRLDFFRLIVQDLVIAAIMLMAALHPRWQPWTDESRTSDRNIRSFTNDEPCAAGN